jgi:hypothetical protein
MSSGEEEMEDEESDSSTMPPPTGKGKAPAHAPAVSKKARPASDGTQQLTRTCKPSAHLKRLIAGEGSADGTSCTYTGWHPYHVSLTKLDADADAGHAEYAYLAGFDDLIAAAIKEAEGDPKSVREVQSCSDWPCWKEAMDCKIDALETAGTWTTVPRPTDKNVVGCKWVFRLKCKADGSIEKYKAWLVVRGFMQIHGVDYFDTYSPVAKLSSFRMLLAMAARYDWEVEAFYFNAAYLNGKLGDGKQIYMQQLPGYEQGSAGLVKKLRKALYRLKQAGHKWYDALKGILTDLEFRVSAADPGVFYVRIRQDTLMLAVHVDDCAMTSSSPKLIAKYKRKLNARYALTDLGPISWLLGIKITCNRDACTISLSQTAYIESILARFSLTDAKAYSTPMVPSATYGKADSPASATDAVCMRKVPYREAIGSLMYASVTTRPDITFTVSTLSQFLENPGEAHWEAVKRVFCYLSGTCDLTLTYGGERQNLEGYTDADRASQDHHQAISSHTFMIDGRAVSWSSRKQELVTLSTAEAEYIAATHAAKECIWMHHLIGELFPPSVSRSTTVHCNNQAALVLVKDDNYHACTKHINIRYHFI